MFYQYKQKKSTVMTYTTNKRLKIWMMLPLLLGATTLLYTACQKQFGSTIDTDSFIGAAKNWFNKEIVQKEKDMLAASFTSLPKDSYARTFVRMGKLNDHLNWNNGKEYNQNGLQYVVVPVEQTIKPFHNQNFEAARAIVFFKDSAGDMQMNIVEAISKKGGSLNMSIADIAAVAFKNKYLKNSNTIDNLSANINFYDKDYKAESSFQTNNGTWSKAKTKFLNKKGTTTKERIATTTPQRTTCQTCTTWYLVGFWYDAQTGQVIDYEILDQWNECNESNPPPPGYGENPDQPIDEDCSVTGPNALDELTSGASVSSETQSITTIESTANTRTKKYEWVILRSIGWRLFSWEKGIHEKTNNTNPSLQWKWQSLDHQNISRVGVVIGGNIDYSLISAIPTLGQYNAIMDLDFKVKYSVVCKGSPISTELVYNSNKNFNVND
jgi:hypothetical protein